MGCSESREDEIKPNSVGHAPVAKHSQKYQYQVYAAIKSEQIDTLKDLLLNNFDFKYKMPTFIGKTVLHLSAEFGSLEITSLLISLGCDVNACDYSGATPVFLAMKFGHLKIVELLIEHSADLNITTSHNLYLHNFINQHKEKESKLLLRKANYCNFAKIYDS